MPWYHYPALVLGGVFLANGAPHFIAGVSGRPFYSPFATPPFRGLSSPAVNVLWALVNASLAYVLLVLVVDFELRRAAHVSAATTGFALASIALARKLRKLQSDG